MSTIQNNTIESFYFESCGQHLFGVLHSPKTCNDKKYYGLIICSPFGEERGFSQRLMVEWANVLCEKGYYVLRFDYRGYGDSDGYFDEFTIEDHLDDLGKALKEYKKRVKVPLIGLCGIRFGATIAALGAERFEPNAGLILWEPVINGEKYADQLLRATMAKEMANTGKAPKYRDQLKKSLASGGKVVVEGHPMNNNIYRSMIDIDLLKTKNMLKGPIQIVQFNRTSNQGPRRDITALKDKYSDVDVNLDLVQLPALWTQTKEYVVRPSNLFEISTSWLDLRVQKSNEAALDGLVKKKIFQNSTPDLKRKTASTESLNSTVNDYNQNPTGTTEKYVEFKCNGDRLRGIIHLPTDYSQNDPAVILLSPGFNCRTARYRLYVRIAREVCKRGFVALRFDPRGLGDSDGILDYNYVSELYNEIENGYHAPDCLAAINFIKTELDIDTVILVGLCGGAAASIHTADQSNSVVGIAPIEVPFLHTINEGMPSEENDKTVIPRSKAEYFLKTYYFKRFYSLHAWLNFFSFKSNYKIFFKFILESIRKRIVFKKRKVYDDNWFIEKLGKRANIGLIRKLQSYFLKGMPIFLIFATNQNFWNYDEVKEGLFRIRKDKKLKQTIHHVVEGADPGFSMPKHTNELIEKLLNWLGDTTNKQSSETKK